MRHYLRMLFLLLPWLHCQADSTWHRVDRGLQLGIFDSPQKSNYGVSRITVVKINPSYFDFKLLCISELGGSPITAKQWCRKHHLVAAINAGMYQTDWKTSVGFLKNHNHINNKNLRKDHKAIFAFNRADSAVPRAQIIDLENQDFISLRPKYRSMVQSIRMISAAGHNVWEQKEWRSSIAALAIDNKNNVLFIFSKSPYSVHDFNNILLKLPLSISIAMYLEGGSPASLYLSANGVKIYENGGFETGMASAAGDEGQPLPNMIGVVRR